MRFPIIYGKNLSGKQFYLPDDFAGTINMVFVAFLQWQQQQVNTWIPLADELTTMYPELRDYELPVVRKMPLFRQKMLENGMRGGIPDVATRDKTITIHTDVSAFVHALNLPGTDTIYTLLLDAGGHIIFNTAGAYTPEKGLALQSVLADLHGNAANENNGVIHTS